MVTGLQAKKHTQRVIFNYLLPLLYNKSIKTIINEICGKHLSVQGEIVFAEKR